MGLPVAVESDVKPTAGQQLFPSFPPTVPPTTEGEWVAGPVTEFSYSTLTAGKKKVIYKAECTFTFTGAQTTPTSKNPVSGTEKVTLTASATKLQGKKTQVLVNGDLAQGPHGNQLKVETSQTKLSTS